MSCKCEKICFVPLQYFSILAVDLLLIVHAIANYLPNLDLHESNFEATDAKMLRVSMSTTYDMINVALKCFQEFGG